MDEDGTFGELERLRLLNEQLAESLRASEDARDLNADLYDHAPLPYVITDRAGVIGRANEDAAALLARDEPRRRQLVGLRTRRFVLDEDGDIFAAHRRACAATDQPQSCEVRLTDGRPVQLWTRRLAPDRRFFATLIVDLRDREQAQAESRRLKQAERNARAEIAARDTFIATLSHELRTPLTPVLAAVTAMRTRADVPPGVRETFEMMRRNIVIETRLIDDLLDVTRIAHGKMSIERRPQDVHELVRESVQMARSDAEAKSLSISVTLDAPIHFAAADPVRLKQVLWNLLKNAVKFTDAGGHIDVRSWNTGAGGAQRLAVEVSDTGIGFEPESAARLLEPFAQGDELPARNGGLGLGLAICRGIMALHDGHIAASSRGPGLGARFVIDIETIRSVEAPASVSVPAGPDLAAPTSTKPRILLVDDHQDTVELLGELLVDAGYEVRTANSGKSAMEVDLGAIDLVVSDIGLPDTSGLDLMRALQRARPLKGIALSGYGTEADVQACKDAGFSAHLTKPVAFERLLATVREVGRRA